MVGVVVVVWGHGLRRAWADRRGGGGVVVGGFGLVETSYLKQNISCETGTEQGREHGVKTKQAWVNKDGT